MDEQKSALEKLVRELPQLLREMQLRKTHLEELAAKFQAGEDLTDNQPRRNNEDVYIIPRRRDENIDARSISSVSSVVSE